MHCNQRDSQTSMRLAKELPACVVVLIFISAIWFESDAYRYVAVGTLLPTAVYYFYRDFPSRTKVLIGYMGLLCIGWSLYVGARFAYSYLSHAELGIGSSEGIYLFPLLYPLSGYALFLAIRRPLIAVCGFILISFLVAVFSIDIPALLEGHRAETLLHNNPIHAAIAQGIVILCAVPFANYLLRGNVMSRGLRTGFFAVSLATVLICFINIYTLQSKGVWLALAIALPFQLILMAGLQGLGRRFAVLAGVIFLMAAISVTMAWDGIMAVADDTAHASAALLSDIFTGRGVIQSMDNAIHDDSAPASFRERLMLWASAILIWMKDPLFGHGVTWMHEWQTRAYPAAEYNLIHNGYLEIAVRYGAAGLIFYALLFSWAARQVWKASREQVIDPAAFQAYMAVLVFFCITVFSNSNIRLAIGESYMWFAAAFGFYCYYKRQSRNTVKVTTWI